MNKLKQRKIGKVVSTQMASTVVVSVDSYISHPLYKKKIRKTRRFLVHDPANQAKLGTVVTIEETRPISKLKRWILVTDNNQNTKPVADKDKVESDK